MRKKSGIVSSLQAARIKRALQIAATRRDEDGRQKREGIHVAVGKHDGCGGTIFGTQESVREETKCTCDKCGQLFNPDFPPYRKQIDDYRVGE